MKKPLIEKRLAEKLIRAHGSPLYIYRKSILERRYRGLIAAITYPHKKIFFACKANSNAELLRHLKRIGSGVECTSRGEVVAALSAGFTPDCISYTCSNITESELMFVARKGITVHLDSLRQLEWWGKARPAAQISLRINGNFGAGANNHLITGGPGSKFGIYYADIPEALRIIKKYRLIVRGIHQHVGSSILDTETFVEALECILDSAKYFPDLEFVDIGGGIGIPYHPSEKPLAVQAFGKHVSNVFTKFCRSYGKNLELWLEPGRYLVAEAGALLVQVTDIKRTTAHVFVGVDSGFNHLIRPVMYGAYHHVFDLSRPLAKKHIVTVVGNVCETDTFAEQREMPLPQVGDLLLIADAGAYGYSMSSNYHLRKKPKEVVLP